MTKKEAFFDPIKDVFSNKNPLEILFVKQTCPEALINDRHKGPVLQIIPIVKCAFGHFPETAALEIRSKICYTDPATGMPFDIFVTICFFILAVIKGRIRIHKGYQKEKNTKIIRLIGIQAGSSKTAQSFTKRQIKTEV